MEHIGDEKEGRILQNTMLWVCHFPSCIILSLHLHNMHVNLYALLLVSRLYMPFITASSAP